MPDVIVVEDNESIAFLMETILSSADYSVHIAESGEEALSICHKYNPHLIFMDLQLPNMDGFTACAMLKNEFPHLNIIGFSAEMSPSVKRKCLAAGMVDAYAKDIEPQAIVDLADKYTG